MSGKELEKLKKFASSLEKTAASTKNDADAIRLKSLAEIMRQPKV